MALTRANGNSSDRTAPDVLPYIDNEIEDYREQVHALVREELERTPRRPPPARPATPPLAPLAALEYVRVEAGLPPPSDLATRFRDRPLPAVLSVERNPTAAAANLEASAAAVEDGRARLEGAEMAVRYGAKNWRVANERLEKAVEGMRREEEVLARELGEIHERRRVEQLVTGAKLATMEQRIAQLREEKSGEERGLGKEDDAM